MQQHMYMQANGIPGYLPPGAAAYYYGNGTPYAAAGYAVPQGYVMQGVPQQVRTLGSHLSLYRW
jgi:hypothetical protein